MPGESEPHAGGEVDGLGRGCGAGESDVHAVDEVDRFDGVEMSLWGHRRNGTAAPPPQPSPSLGAGGMPA